MTARERFEAAHVARMATVAADGTPHLVPIVFVLADDTVYSCVDDKPKRTKALARLKNIASTGRVCLLVDHYAEDWSRLWWVRVDGAAQVLAGESAEGGAAIDLLVAKYPQYAATRPSGPVIAVRNLRWREWAAAGTA